MKKILILLLVLSSVKTFAQTSVYHPFPDSNATWNIEYTQAQCMFGFGFEEYTITLSGDTAINGISYKKLSVPFVDFYTLGSCSPYNTSGYKGAIREDEQERKVFFVAPSDENEQILYDFTLQTGDTVRGVLTAITWSPTIVESIDSILIGNTFRKRWNINSWYSISIIEGFGSTFGLIQPNPGYITDASTFLIGCFSQDGITQYPDNTYNCELITAIPETNKTIEPISVFPNPSHGSFTISLNPGSSLEKLCVVNLLGNIVYQCTGNLTSSHTINGVLPGSYLIQCYQNEHQVSVQKLIIYP